MTCNEDDLVALARDELPPVRAAEIEAHVARCPGCEGELAWLRAEAKLFARRPGRDARPPATQWAAIADRIVVEGERAAARRKRRRGWIGAGAGAAIAVAAVAVRLLLPQAPQQQPATIETPASAPVDDGRHEVRIAVERAEKEYGHALDLLEAAWRDQRRELPAHVAEMRDAEIARMRREVAEIRGLAGDDLDGRLRALQATAAYVRSMQRIVLEEEVP